MFDPDELKVVNKIFALGPDELKDFLAKTDDLSGECWMSNLAKGYALYRLDRIAEAAQYLSQAELKAEDFGHLLTMGTNPVVEAAENLCSADSKLLNVGYILETGYYKGCDGNWHSYDDGGFDSNRSSASGGGNDDDNCCDTCLGGGLIVGGLLTFLCSGKCILDSCCGCDAFCGEDFCLDGCTTIGGGLCDSCCHCC